MKNILLFYYGVDADKSGLRRKINWKWFIYDIAEVFIAVIGGIAIAGFIALNLIK